VVLILTIQSFVTTTSRPSIDPVVQGSQERAVIVADARRFSAKGVLKIVLRSKLLVLKQISGFLKQLPLLLLVAAMGRPWMPITMCVFKATWIYHTTSHTVVTWIQLQCIRFQTLKPPFNLTLLRMMMSSREIAYIAMPLAKHGLDESNLGCGDEVSENSIHLSGGWGQGKLNVFELEHFCSLSNVNISEPNSTTTVHEELRSRKNPTIDAPVMAGSSSFLRQTLRILSVQQNSTDDIHLRRFRTLGPVAYARPPEAS
jgi:hypothetical protein